MVSYFLSTSWDVSKKVDSLDLFAVSAKLAEDFQAIPNGSTADDRQKTAKLRGETVEEDGAPVEDDGSDGGGPGCIRPGAGERLRPVSGMRGGRWGRSAQRGGRRPCRAARGSDGHQNVLWSVNYSQVVKRTGEMQKQDVFT